jgi:CRP-like cAMP-binding protein
VELGPDAPLDEWRDRIYTAFVSVGTRRRYRRGEALFVQGEPATVAFALESGRVTVGRVAPTGREIIHVFHYPGSVFGFVELLLQRERNRSAYAGDDSVLWVVPYPDLLDLVRRRPDVLFGLLLTLSDRFLATQTIVEELVAESVAERLVRLLVRLGGELGYNSHAGHAPIPIRLTHEEIAQVIGSTRQTVTSLLSALENRGLVYVRPRSITIMDWKRLQRMASHDLGP